MCKTKKEKKKKTIRVWVCVAPSCSACPQAVPPCPLPSCYAITSSPPPQPDPVAPSPPTRQRQALVSVSMQKTRGWGPLQHAKPDSGMSTPPRAWQTPYACPRSLPVRSCQHFRMATVSVKSGLATRTLSYTKVRTLYQRSAFLSALKTLLSSLISG